MAGFEPVSLPVVAASLVLVGVALAVSGWLGLGIGRSVTWASLRAAVQLLAVGAVFTAIFRAPRALVWSWGWVTAMVVVAAWVVWRRVPSVPAMALPAALSLGGAAALSLAVLFGLEVFAYDPVTLVVLGGITIGNAMPSAVLAVEEATSLLRHRPGEVEALLALGFDRRGAVRQVAARAARLALIPQVERTKVVGLIALPGAMTGLLLAGVDPVEAVVVQLLVMLLVLGSAAVAVVVMVAAVARAAVSDQLVLAPWVRAVTARPTGPAGRGRSRSTPSPAPRPGSTSPRRR